MVLADACWLLADGLFGSGAAGGGVGGRVAGYA